MTRFTTRWDTVTALPDWHLVQAVWTPTGRGLHIAMHFRADHAHPDLVRDLDEYFRHLAHSDVYEMQPERAQDPPEFTTTYERVRPELLPLQTFALRVRGSHYLFLVRADMMTLALALEINEHLLAQSQGALRTARRNAPTAPHVDLNLSLLDEYSDELMDA